MRIGSVPHVRQPLLLMLAAAQREPALIRRRKRFRGEATESGSLAPPGLAQQRLDELSEIPARE
jgi:hypothetical protein